MAVCSRISVGYCPVLQTTHPQMCVISALHCGMQGLTSVFFLVIWTWIGKPATTVDVALHPEYFHVSCRTLIAAVIVIVGL